MKNTAQILDPARVAVDARNTVSEILTLFAIAFAVKPQRVLSSNELWPLQYPLNY